VIDLDALNFGKGGGLVTVVAQDGLSGAVLMVAFADREALQRTQDTGDLHFRSRTRGLWRKGETSGNVLRVLSLLPDCDGDAVLARVVPAGPACHTGASSCFGPGAEAADALGRLDQVIESRAREPLPGSYTARLLADRNLRLKKIGEEAAELIAACADGDANRACAEAADLLYHALVAVRAAGGGWQDVRRILQDRERASARARTR